MTEKAVVSGIERYALNYAGNPTRYKTATCDACGFQRSEVGPVAFVAALLRREGWSVSEVAEYQADCLCPRCAATLYAQLGKAKDPPPAKGASSTMVSQTNPSSAPKRSDHRG